VPFDPADPVNTPNTLAATDPLITHAFADAVLELSQAGIPVDAALGDFQYVERNGERIPLSGGGGGEDGVLGVFNVIDGTFNTSGAAVGYTGPTDGSGYMHVVQFDGDACPKAATLLSYSQSSDPSSPHYKDQTHLFAKKQWVTERFCDADIAASPALEVVQIGTVFAPCKRGGLASCKQ
jgi:acyl-homoserine-lactone acylase